MKTKNQRGFTAVEGLIVLLVVVALGGAGFYVWNKNQNAKPASASKTATALQPQAYKRTTTVPDGWKAYSDAAYNFNFSYMPTWTVTPIASAALTTSPNQVAEVDLSSLNPTESKGTLAGDGLTISVFKQSLAKTLAYEKSVLQSAQQQTADAGKPLKITTTDLTYDGNATVKYVSYTSQNAVPEIAYIIFHNGYSYIISLISSNSNKANPISKNTLTAFESLKFSKVSTQTSTQKFMTIKEWGVKLPLTANDEGAYYTYGKATGNELADSVSIFDKNFDATKNANGVSCKQPDFPLFAISRIKPVYVTKVQDINSNYYIGDTGPSDFKYLPFTKEYEFAALRYSQAAPNCVDLSLGTNNPTKIDASVDAKLSAWNAAIANSYANMQAE